MNELLFGLLLLISVVLVIGLFLMGKGGKANEKYGNKLMLVRIVLQGVILLLVIIILSADKG